MNARTDNFLSTLNYIKIFFVKIMWTHFNMLFGILLFLSISTGCKMATIAYFTYIKHFYFYRANKVSPNNGLFLITNLYDVRTIT